MPRHLIPQRSGVHRFACLALYRSLLRQTAKLPPENQYRHAAQRKIRDRLRNNFRQNAKLHTPSAIVTALGHGYHALNTLQLALTGDNQSRRLLLQQVEGLKPTPPTRSASAQQPEKKRNEHRPVISDQKAGSNPTAKPISILDRPFPVLSGRRTVPYLISANGFPFLRYKNPQPPALSRVINDRIKAYCHRWDRSYEYQDQVQMGKLEDAWERDLHRYCRFGRGSDPSPSWSEEPWKALDFLHATARRQSTRAKTMAMDMYHVMEKERELAQKEKLARRDVRHKRYKAKRLAQRDVAQSEEIPAIVPAAMTGR